MKLISLISASILFLASCSNNVEKKVEATPTNTSSDMNKEASRYTPEMVVNKEDFTCGMPVSAGISDTCHVDGNAYGFCSAECKDEFLKDPKKYLTKK
jgi:YHS domain-containing protein